MTEGMKQIVATAIDSPKVGAAVSAATITTGLSSRIWSFIPQPPADIAACIGGALSVVLIYTHLKKYVLERRLLKLKIKALELENKGR